MIFRPVPEKHPRSVLNHNPRPGAVFSLDTNNPQSMLESVHFRNMTSVSIFELTLNGQMLIFLKKMKRILILSNVQN